MKNKDTIILESLYDSIGNDSNPNEFITEVPINTYHPKNQNVSIDTYDVKAKVKYQVVIVKEGINPAIKAKVTSVDEIHVKYEVMESGAIQDYVITVEPEKIETQLRITRYGSIIPSELILNLDRKLQFENGELLFETGEE